MSGELQVKKRNGSYVPLNPNKITNRLSKLIHQSPDLSKYLKATRVMISVTSKLKNRMTTSEIDEFSAEQAEQMALSNNPIYLQLASRIAIDNHHKKTLNNFHDSMQILYLNKDTNGNVSSMLSVEYMKFVRKHREELSNIIDYSRDFDLTYFGFKTLLRSYLLKTSDQKIIERPQDTFMRTAIQLHMRSGDIKKVKTTYDKISLREFTHATPTLFNSGSKNPQLASCFLVDVHDSLDGIMNSLKQCATISKTGGGIGISLANLRSDGSLIRSTNGHSSGISKFNKIFNHTALAFNQGGKRNGSFATYLPLHHPDIKTFLILGNPETPDDIRAVDLNYGVMISDLFMNHVKNKKMWALIDPDTCPELYEAYGEEFVKIYNDCVEAKKYKELVNPRTILDKIYEANQRTGQPYICFTDTINRCNNQSNLGKIKQSNLCTEIYEKTSIHETAVCNLASICLSKCVIDDNKIKNEEFPVNPKVDLFKLVENVKIITENLNNTIDCMSYPVKEASNSNMRHRPIGIGVQGWWDMCMKMRYPLDSTAAADLNKHVFETILYAALTESLNISKTTYHRHVNEIKTNGFTMVKEYSNPDDNKGKSYELMYNSKLVKYTSVNDLPKTVGAYPSFKWNGGSPLSHGKFHWELAGKTKSDLCGKWNWEVLRANIMTYGVANSLLVAPMPTASTSQIMGNTECIEPIISNIFTRKVLSGEHIVINKYLINDLLKRNIPWDPTILEKIIANNGSIQSLTELTAEQKSLYRIAFEYDQKVLINLAADRQPFVDQGQSLNWYIQILTKNYFMRLVWHAWKSGLKTCKYYVHQAPAVTAKKFSISHNQEISGISTFGIVECEKNDSKLSLLNPIDNHCLMCSG